MKNMGFRISLLTIATVASSLVAAQVVPASASTPVKAISPAKAGRTTTTPVSNTLLNGKGAPSVTVGIDGDFYIDIASLNMYGPKKNGKWPVPISMKGPAGPTGPTGIDGKIGKEGSPTVGNSGTTGPKGEQGTIGLQGAPGEKGLAGVPGVPGSQGTAGSAGSSGLPGAQGVKGDSGASGSAGATGATGSTGATGAPGSSGSQGSQGIQGIKGDVGNTGPTGSQGVAGNSAVQVATLTPWQLSSSVPGAFSTSGAFGLLAIGTQYEFTIVVVGKTSGFPPEGKLGLVLTCTDSGAVLKFEVQNSFHIFATSASDISSRYSYVIVGSVSNLTSAASLAIRAVTGDGTTGVNYSGQATIQIAGSVS